MSIEQAVNDVVEMGRTDSNNIFFSPKWLMFPGKPQNAQAIWGLDIAD